MSLHGMSTPTNKLIALTLAFKCLHLIIFHLVYELTPLNYQHLDV